MGGGDRGGGGRYVREGQHRGEKEFLVVPLSRGRSARGGWTDGLVKRGETGMRLVTGGRERIRFGRQWTPAGTQ